MTVDYRLTLKVQNNYLLEKMNEHGIKSIAELSRFTEVSQGALGDILNLKIAAFNEAGRIYPRVQKLCDFFCCEAYELFPPQHLEQSLRTNSVQFKANIDQFMPEYLLDGATDPADLLSFGQNKLITTKMLSVLREKEREVLTLRFGLDGDEPHTYEDIGDIYGITGPRVRQIEENALRKLRGKTQTAELASEIRK